MVSAVQSSITGALGAAGGVADSEVALKAALARCQRQLGDWVACPSAKTPEGKKIIETLRVRISALESRIAQTPSPTRTSAIASAAPPASTPSSTIGSLIDLYA